MSKDIELVVEIEVVSKKVKKSNDYTPTINLEHGKHSEYRQ